MFYLLICYLLLGIGVLGASHVWTHVGWAWYSVFFPAHSILISVSGTLWRFIRAALSRPIVQFILLVLLFWYLSGGD